jgi:hypothetical protein
VGEPRRGARREGRLAITSALGGSRRAHAGGRGLASPAGVAGGRSERQLLRSSAGIGQGARRDPRGCEAWHSRWLGRADHACRDPGAHALGFPTGDQAAVCSATTQVLNAARSQAATTAAASPRSLRSADWTSLGPDDTLDSPMFEDMGWERHAAIFADRYRASRGVGRARTQPTVPRVSYLWKTTLVLCGRGVDTHPVRDPRALIRGCRR